MYPPTDVTVKSQVFRKQPKAKPKLVFNAGISGDSKNKTDDRHSQTILEAANEYSVPTSSNVVRYNAKTNEVQLPKRKNEVAYHDQGPDVGHSYDYCGSQSQEVKSTYTDYRETLAHYEAVSSHRVS